MTRETARLAALERYGVLDTPPDAVFDGITQAVADLCETPIALISLIDTDRQWFKSCVGMAMRETSRDLAFCAHAIESPDDFLEVEDATQDARFRDNPLVTGDPNIRFYAGQPLVTRDGFALGTLCVIDSVPRRLGAAQRNALIRLAGTVVDLFEERRSSPASTISHAIEETIHSGIIIADAQLPDQPISYCNRGFEALTGYSKQEIVGKNCRFLQGEKTDPGAVARMREALRTHVDCTLTLLNYRKDGSEFWNELTISPIQDTTGEVTHYLGFQNDVSTQHRAEVSVNALGAVLETAINEILMFDENSLQFVHMNKGARDNLGYGMEELAAMTIVDIMPEFTVDSVEVAMKPLRDGSVSLLDFTTLHGRKDGSTYPVEVHLQRSHFDGVPVFVAVVLDITKRTQTEEALAQSRLFMESMPDATLIASGKGVVDVANSQMSRLFGYAADELSGMRIDLLLPERKRDWFFGFQKRLHADPKVNELDSSEGLFALTKDGREVPVEVTVTPIETSDGLLFAAAFKDRSERVERQRQLQESEARYQDLFENATDLIQSVLPDGRFSFVNPAWKNLLGYTDKEIESLSMWDVIHPDNRAHCEIEFGRVMAGETLVDVKAEFLKKSGDKVYVEGGASCRFEDGKPVVTRAIFHDVTQRRRHEADLTEAKDRAEVATAAKSRFLAAASHDLRQPLQSIGLYLSVLGRIVDQPKAQEVAEKMQDSVGAMAELLDTLLDISSLDSGSITAEIVDFPIESLFAQITASNEPQANEKGLSFSCAGDASQLRTDPALLARVIENFVTNAIRYTDSGSIEVRCTEVGSNARIEVRDTGAGIPADALDTIFEEYRQLDNPTRDRSKGLGLGLSIVSHIVRLLDLELDVSSVVGGGSVFSVLVPLGSSEATQQSLNVAIAARTSVDHPPVVIFVDDDPAIVDATAMLMESSGVEVYSALSGDEALAHLNAGVTPDMIVSDFRLPGYSGVEVIKRMRAATSEDLPAILMTGDTSALEIEAAQLANCSVLHKPVDTDILMGLIEGLVPSVTP